MQDWKFSLLAQKDGDCEQKLIFRRKLFLGFFRQNSTFSGRFIIEYMGEIVDTKEVLRRIRRYGKDPNHKHHYLMALRNGTLIDATVCGNDARFINHSCEPNAATQKWTVGRQLRIGKFIWIT